MRILCGTSGYDYDAWQGRFYPVGLPKSQRLTYYAERFPTVESNYTFRSLPTEKILSRWVAKSPEGFRFALKAWQRITHHRRLRGGEEAVASFAAAARALGDRLGPILVQLPPNLKRDVPLLDAFLAGWPGDLAAAFEFRHASWFDDAVFSSLSMAGAALCIADDEALSTPMVRTAAFGYLRLRRADYDAAALDQWAEQVRGAGFTSDVSIYFKHEDTAEGPRLARSFSARFEAFHLTEGRGARRGRRAHDREAT